MQKQTSSYAKFLQIFLYTDHTLHLCIGQHTCGQTTGKPVYENYKHAAYDDNMKWYGASDAFVAAVVTTCNALLTNLSIYWHGWYFWEWHQCGLSA